MRALADVTGTRIAQLIGVGGPLPLPLNLLTEYPHDPHGHIGNPLLYGPVNWRINSTERPMTLEHEPHYQAYRARRTTSMYDDAVSDLDLPHGCQSALMYGADGIVGISLLRSSREGPCDAEVLDCFSLLARQAQRALRVQLALGQEAADLMLSGTASQRGATLLLDRFGSLCSATPTGERMMEDDGPFRLSGLMPILRNPAEDGALRQALGRLMASGEGRGPVLHRMIVGRSVEHPAGQWDLFAARLPRQEHGLGFDPEVAVTLRPLLRVPSALRN